MTFKFGLSESERKEANQFLQDKKESKFRSSLELMKLKGQAIDLEEYEKSKKILQDPKLYQRLIKTEFDKKIVGEETSRSAIFLSGCSIWVANAKPLHLMINSESSAGKSYICNKIIKIFPKHLVEYRTKVTSQAFTYWHDSRKEPQWTWDGKICYIEDVSQTVLDSDVFKVMCSEGSIATIVSNQIAIDIKINGKPLIMVTTAETNPKNEILNRFGLIYLDESSAQTKAIMTRMARNRANSEEQDYDPNLIKALSYLQRIKVKIPYAENLVQYFSQNDVRMRRDFERILTLIESSTALHQFQREVDENGFYIADRQDYEIARSVINAFKYYGPQLTNSVRKFYDFCKTNIKNDFTIEEIVAKYPEVSERQVRKYLEQLLKLKLAKRDLEKNHQSERGRRNYIYTINAVEVNMGGLPEFDKLSSTINT